MSTRWCQRAFTLWVMALTGLYAWQAMAESDVAEARNQLRRYFEQLPRRSDKRLVSGQQAGMGEGVPFGFERNVARLHQTTGKWPGLIGADYGYGPKSNAVWDLSLANGVLIDYWHRGGLVTS